MSGAPSGKLEEGEGKGWVWGGRIRTKKKKGARPSVLLEKKHPKMSRGLLSDGQTILPSVAQLLDNLKPQ